MINYLEAIMGLEMGDLSTPFGYMITAVFAGISFFAFVKVVLNFFGTFFGRG